MRESLRERAIHLRIAPELVELKAFFIPVYRDTRRRPWQLKIGLWLYALLGGFDAATRFGSVPKSEWPSLDGLKLTINITNLGDEKYVSSCYYTSWCWYGSQRTVRANLRYNW